MQNFGGATRRRFPALCEKPEGGGKQPPYSARVNIELATVAVRKKIEAVKWKQWWLDCG